MLPLRMGAIIALTLTSSVIVLACGGGAGPDTSADAPPSDRMTITAKNLRFDKRTLVALPNQTVTITFVNDESALHNVSVYTARNAREPIHEGELFVGPKTVDETFTSPGPGEYFFRCDAHPDTMSGTFLVRGD